MNPPVVSDDMHDPEFRRLLAQEELILEVTEVLCGLLEAETISKKELADRLGKTKGFVSQLLNGGRNLTLRTLAAILHVLGYKVSLTAQKIRPASLQKPKRNPPTEKKSFGKLPSGKLI
jgi:transcriptional regulator with XRE-family HTH domain